MSQGEIDPLCRTCGRPLSNHPFRHPFVSMDAKGNSLIARDDDAHDHASRTPQENQGHVRIAPAGDPVLRMIMIRKGIITVEDLDNLEAELRATGVAGYEPGQTLG